MHGVQAAQLPDAEVEAELAGPGRVQEVLPLVRQAYRAPGDPLVARQTRSERRARRAAQAESRAALERAPQQRAPQQQQQQARPTAVPAHTDGHHVPGRGATRFISESWGELKKVDWPGQQQLVQGTAVVLIACLVTGVYLFLADELFRRFVQHVLLGG
jgi:preprotein translocase subunit SecE